MGVKKYSVEQEKQIAKEYIEGVPVEQLVKKYNYSTRKSITDKVKKYYPEEWENIKTQRRILQKGYDYKLEKISSEFDAYFLGLMLTDGYVVKSKNAVGIDLTDEDCIKFLSEIIGKNYTTYDDNNHSHIYNDREIISKKKRHRLYLNSEELKSNLSRFGVVENKTYIIPKINLLTEEEKYIPYIIRGIIDGDGEINITNETFGIRITTMSSEFAQWIKEILENKLYCSDISIHQKNTGIYSVETYKKDNMIKILSLVYNKPFGMNRKYEKFRKMFRDYNGNFLDN